MDSFIALADPTRRRIIELLLRGEHAAGEITGQFDLSAPAISQHLKVLRQARLVQVRIEGQRRIYSLDPEGLKQADQWLSKVRPFWSERLDRLERALAEPPARPRKRRRR